MFPGMRPAARHRFLSEPTGVKAELVFPSRKLLSADPGVEGVDARAFADARRVFTTDPDAGAAMFEELGYRVHLTKHSGTTAVPGNQAPGRLALRRWITVMTLAGAIPMLVKIFGIIDLDPEPLTLAVNRGEPVQIAAWLFLAAAAVWGFFSICRYIAATAVTAFACRAGWAQFLAALSVSAFTAGMATGSLLYGVLGAAALAYISGGTAGVEGKRGDRTHE